MLLIVAKEEVKLLPFVFALALNGSKTLVF